MHTMIAETGSAQPAHEIHSRSSEGEAKARTVSQFCLKRLLYVSHSFKRTFRISGLSLARHRIKPLLRPGPAFIYKSHSCNPSGSCASGSMIIDALVRHLVIVLSRVS